MGVFEMVVAIVAIVTTGRVAQSFARRRSAAAADHRIEALEAALQTNETRLSQNEEKIAELNEKLGFVEALLARPEHRSQIPPPS